jgi:hypothetical protein
MKHFRPAILTLLVSIGHAAPLALHPENPRYLLWEGEPTVLVTSGEHYGLLLNTAFDHGRYFAELAAHGLNHTRVFSGVYREVPGSFGITDNPLAPGADDYICPWPRSATKGAADGRNKFDLSKWNPAYFQRLREMMREAAKHGIVVEFTLFCPMYRDEMWSACPMNVRNNINGIGRCGRTEVYALKHADLTNLHEAFVTKAAEELRDFDNLYFEICNEPYFGGVTGAWQRRMIDVLAAADQGRHLISLNIANGRKKVENPHPAVSIFNFHYCVPPDTVAMNFGLGKVIGENETGFRGKADVLYRTEGWDFLLAGGALYNNLDYSFTPGHPDGSLRDYKSPGGGSRELRRQLGILKKFVESFEFTAMRPATGVVKRTEPELTASVLANAGKAYAIYLHTPVPNKPKKLEQLLRKNRTARVTLEIPKGIYRMEWLNPVTGRTGDPWPLRHSGGAVELVTPAFDNDIALRIVRP